MTAAERDKLWMTVYTAALAFYRAGGELDLAEDAVRDAWNDHVLLLATAVKS